MRTDLLKHLGRGLLAMAAASCLTLAHGRSPGPAVIQIVNGNEPGIGFNDPSPALPVGGNTATTVGGQRLAVFQYAANLWGTKLKSDVPITILSTFEPLPCTATGATLGAAGAISVWSDFPGAEKPGTWYSSALANKLAGEDIDPVPSPTGDDLDIVAFFNSDLGQADCLAGSGFYLGLDGLAPTGQIDLLATILHEFGHGLGFQTFTSGRTGNQLAGLPSIWDHYLYDPAQNKTWVKMTAAERAVSGITPRNLQWYGNTVIGKAAVVLDRGTPELFLTGPGLDRNVLIGTALFGPQIDSVDDQLSAQIAQVVDQVSGTGLACTPLSAANAAAVRGKIALVDRGTCGFTIKVKNAQDAGARAVIVSDNVAGGPPPDLGGVDPTITIPAVRISLEDGTALKASLATPSKFGNYGVLSFNTRKLAGADYGKRVFMFTPNPFQQGSSVSHFDTSAKPNLLMEPFLNAGQPIAVSAPRDLTFELLKDIGW